MEKYCMTLKPDLCFHEAANPDEYSIKKGDKLVFDTKKKRKKLKKNRSIFNNLDSKEILRLSERLKNKQIRRTISYSSSNNSKSEIGILKLSTSSSQRKSSIGHRSISRLRSITKLSDSISRTASDNPTVLAKHQSLSYYDAPSEVLTKLREYRSNNSVANDLVSSSNYETTSEEEDDENWVKMRRLNSTTGGFVPVSYLQTTYDKFVIAKEHYVGEDYELTFQQNDIIEVLKEEKDMVDTEGYAFGRLIITAEQEVGTSESEDEILSDAVRRKSKPGKPKKIGLFPIDLVFEFDLGCEEEPEIYSSEDCFESSQGEIMAPSTTATPRQPESSQPESALLSPTTSNVMSNSSASMTYQINDTFEATNLTGSNSIHNSFEEKIDSFYKNSNKISPKAGYSHANKPLQNTHLNSTFLQARNQLKHVQKISSTSIQEVDEENLSSDSAQNVELEDETFAKTKSLQGLRSNIRRKEKRTVLNLTEFFEKKAGIS